jgi:cyclic 2,3-diphosphoglycerate synthetase
MAEEGTPHARLAAAVREVKDVPVVACTVRPRPVEAVAGRRVAFFSTAPSSALPLLEAHLRDAHDADVVLSSSNLSDRERLREDVERARGAEVFLVELKAAAIDVVAEAAAEHGAELVLADADVVAVEGDVDGELRALVAAALDRVAVA